MSTSAAAIQQVIRGAVVL